MNNKLLPAHAQLLDGLHIEGELLRSRMQRKPAQGSHYGIRHQGGTDLVGAPDSDGSRNELKADD